MKPGAGIQYYGQRGAEYLRECGAAEDSGVNVAWSDHCESQSGHLSRTAYQNHPTRHHVVGVFTVMREQNITDLYS